MKYKNLIILLILSLLLTGCPEKRILDELGIVNARGMDIENQDKIKANFVIFQFEEQSQNITKVVSGKGDTVNGAMHNANYETNFLLQHGKIQIDLYGKELAKKRSEEHTSELQSRFDLVCRLLLEKKKRDYSPLKAEADNCRDDDVKNISHVTSMKRKNER